MSAVPSPNRRNFCSEHCENLWQWVSTSKAPGPHLMPNKKPAIFRSVWPVAQSEPKRLANNRNPPQPNPRATQTQFEPPAWPHIICDSAAGQHKMLYEIICWNVANGFSYLFALGPGPHFYGASRYAAKRNVAERAQKGKLLRPSPMAGINQHSCGQNIAAYFMFQDSRTFPSCFSCLAQMRSSVKIGQDLHGRP